MNDLDRQLAVLGIDPGLDGAVALILPDGVEAHVTPTIAAAGGGKRQFDIAGMVALLERHRVELAVIEAVGPMAKQGVVSMFRFGQGYGLWLGMLAALKIPHLAVTPRAWKKAILAGTPKDKGAAIQWAQRRYPGVSLLATARSKVPHDGLADALAMAEFARRLQAETVAACLVLAGRPMCGACCGDARGQEDQREGPRPRSNAN
jgi:crossover junction endodeoxyribonuclease RuvC